MFHPSLCFSLFNSHSCPDHDISEDVKRNVDIEMSQISMKTETTDDKVKEQNRICQLAFKARKKMPKDYKSFCLVAEHLAKNAHRYYKQDETGKAIEGK